MSFYAWIFIALVIVTVLGGLYKLYITAWKMPIDKETMARIKARQSELEEQEAREKTDD